MTSYKVKKKKDQERYETPETIDKPTGIVITKWTSTCTGPLLHRKLDVKKVKRFLTNDGKANSNTVVSIDGNRAVQRTPTAGKKTGQRKRKRAELSTIPNAKRKL